MKSTDIKDLVSGLITIILIAIAFGQYGKLREFVVKEAKEAMNVGKATPTFFPKTYDAMKHVKHYETK